MTVTNMTSRFSIAGRPAIWRGRSGRIYGLIAERLETFTLAPDALYMIARGPVPMWAGSAADVIDDQQSRARFRLALAAADRVFRVAEADPDPTARATMIWDLEGAEPDAALSSAA
jgi:hypothetical protein